jgi:hypothetical protein
MQTIHTTQTVGPDGNIRLDFPAGRAGEQLDVLIVLSKPQSKVSQADWHKFIHEMAGSCPELLEPAGK